MFAESSSRQGLLVCIARQKQREREALHRWLLYATFGSAIAHILLLGISIKQNSLVVVQQEKLPDSIDLTLLTTAPELPKSTTSAEPPPIPEDANPRAITEPVTAVNPVENVANNTPTVSKSRSEKTPQLDTASANTSITPPTAQTANVESIKASQENPASENMAIPNSSVSNLPEPANQEVVNGTNNLNNREQGTAVSSTNPSSITGFSDRIRNLLRGNSPNSNPSSNPSALQTNPTPSTAEPTQPQKVQCIRCDKPQYPAEARNRGLQGQARVAVDVDAEGNVTNVRLINSSGHAELDEAAVRQARQWKFTPSVAGRQGIGAKVDFQLEGTEYQRQRQRERQEQPKPLPPAEFKPEVARQEMPNPVPPAEVKPAPVPEVARQEIPEKPDVAVPPPEPIAPNPPAVVAPPPSEND